MEVKDNHFEKSIFKGHMEVKDNYNKNQPYLISLDASLSAG